jgi:single-stranded-DNA-specific exonuclease
MQKIWKLKEPDIELKNALSAELGTSSIFAQLLASRGITDKIGAEVFLRAELTDLYDPFLMKGMRPAVTRIRQAIVKKEPIFIATDFDVDGVTSCTILESELKRLGAVVEHYVPHRVKDGYGLNAEAVDLAKKFKAGLFISLDCGITSLNEAAALKKHGIDFIIVDHHEPPQKELPQAIAILNPKQDGCAYPFKELASVGLAYKLIQALEAKDAHEYLDLVALGTVADVVPLRSENRIFVRHGLDVLNSTKRKGIRSLMSVAGVKEKKVSTHSISFILAPRLNASGRMNSAQASLDLLLSNDALEADRLAQYLNDHNRQRQKVEEEVLGQAMDLIASEVNFKDDFIIVLSKEDWHPGVLGIVASKIADRFYRPAIIISLEGEVGRGSARSVPNFHIYEALVRCEVFLKEYGGHKYAAGLTIERGKIQEFKALLNMIAKENFKNELYAPTLDVDVQVPLSMINEELLDSIDKLSPFGEGNRRPVFVSRGLKVKSKPLLVGKNSLKFWVTDGEGTFEAIGFGMSDFFDLVNQADRIDMAYGLGRDSWNPHNPIQIEIKDIKISS